MAIYVMSDMHGHYDEFLEMLLDIKFSKNDTLYILGDVIDRGPKPIKMLQHIFRTENMILLMGNHEKMMLDSSSTNPSVREEAGDMWVYNGGYTTIHEFNKLTKEERQEIINKIAKLKWYEILEIGDKKYFLSHAGLITSERYDFDEALKRNIENEWILWNREELKFWTNTSPYIMIHGHTPSGKWHPKGQYKITKYDKGKKINIDCGCARDENLGCLRLDDMKEFYVKCEELY